jgi:hypothetical protein
MRMKTSLGVRLEYPTCQNLMHIPPYGRLKDKVGDSGARQQLPIVVGVGTVARNLVSGGILRLAPRENQIAYPALPKKSARCVAHLLSGKLRASSGIQSKPAGLAWPAGVWAAGR